MLIFGCCIGPSGKFESIALPALAQVMQAEDVLVREQGSEGICAAYNRILAQAMVTPNCEGVVLLHDDVRLAGDARSVIVQALQRENVGVVGVVGGRRLFGASWGQARELLGVVNDSHNDRRACGPPSGCADVVDGLLLAISPQAYAQIEFDAVHLPGFHGYDVDFCLQVRSKGLDVFVAPIDYEHHDKHGYGNRSDHDAAADWLNVNWSEWITPLYRWERLSRWVAAEPWKHTGRLRHGAAVVLKRRFGWHDAGRTSQWGQDGND